MLPRLLIACATVGGCAPLLAQDNDAEVKKVAKAQAEEAQSLLVQGEYGKFVALTHPRIVEGMGGKDKMVDRVAALFQKMKDQGFEMKSVAVGDPGDPIRVGKETYVGVPITIEMVAPGGRLRSKGILVGISNDGGKTWQFADAAPGRETLRKVFPDLPEAIVFPKKEPPTFVKD